jgi:hypothetical protein
VGLVARLEPSPARRVGAAGTLAAARVGRAAFAAQTLAPKRTLTTGAAPGCDLAPAITDASSPRNTAEARRLAVAGQEATLEGDQVAARDAFARASQLNPGRRAIALRPRPRA